MTQVVDPLFAARPLCREEGCEAVVLRSECSWELNGDGDWVPKDVFLVCQNAHRRPVERFPMELPS